MLLDFVVYLISMCFTPGPNVVLAMSNSSQKGFKKTLPLMLGMITGITFITVISYFLISFLTHLVSRLTFFLQIAGVVYLMYLAVSFLMKKGLTQSQESGNFKRGVILQFLNVKFLMLVVTANANFIIPMNLSTVNGLFTILLIPICCFSALLLWSAAGSVLSKWYTKIEKPLNIIFFLSLATLAVKNVINLF